MFRHFLAEGTDAALDFDIEVEPGRRVYCFIGENGAGKTTLLENLGRAFLCAHTMFDLPVQNGASKARFSGVSRIIGIYEALSSLTLLLPSRIQLDSRLVKVSTPTPVNTVFKDHHLTRKSLDPGHWIVDRPMIMIGARDRGFAENLSTDRVRLLGDRPSRFVQTFLRTYAAMTRQKVEAESLAEWFAARVLIHPSVSRGDDRSFEVETVLRLMEELDPKTFSGIAERDETRALRHILYVDGKLMLGAVPFDRLPSGFVSILKLFQEILSGFAGWSAMEDNRDLASMDGLVLIDEIEAHLHPMWQARVIPLLKRFFPNTTFFVATHSPLIAATTAEGEAYELVRAGQRVTARALGNPGAWYLADVYEQAFHVELPAPGEIHDIAELLVQLSVRVKDHLRTKDPTARADAIALYDRITPSIPPTDPRRSSLDALRGMLG